MKTLVELWPLFLGVGFLLWLAWWNSKPRFLKKAEPEALSEMLVPPGQDMIFLANCGYSAEDAKRLWQEIRTTEGDEDYFTIKMFARKKYTRWYLRLSQVEKKKFEWDNLWNELKGYVENDPNYWQIQPSLLEFVFRVRAHTG